MQDAVTERKTGNIFSGIDRGLALQGTCEEEDRPFEEYLVGSKVHEKIRDQRERLMVTRAYCSSRGSKFGSQHPYQVT